MTSKKKSNSAFGATFGWGMFFISILAIILASFAIGIVNYLIPDDKQRVSTEENRGQDLEETKSEETQKPDTVYITKTVVEKCNKKHYTDEISTPPSPIEADKQHDSTNN